MGPVRRQNADGHNVDGHNVDGLNVDGQNVDGPNADICSSNNENENHNVNFIFRSNYSILVVITLDNSIVVYIFCQNLGLVVVSFRFTSHLMTLTKFVFATKDFSNSISSPRSTV